jgi:EPS-associated MarR family transcriptional regulator
METLVGASSLANKPHMNEETSYKLFNLVEQQPNISQRELAKEMGISLGKTNYCLKGLMVKGWVKAQNFKNSNNKIAYAYVLTPRGLREKAKITARFLKRKVSEYEILKNEIEQLQQEVSENINNS